MDTLDDVLAHYGILGMKWGVRRDRRQLERARKKKAINKRSFDSQRAENVKKKAKKGGAKALSNQELQQLTQRMNLEQQYSTMLEKNSKISKGKVLVDSALGVGKTVQEVTKFANSPLGKDIAKQLMKKK